MGKDFTERDSHIRNFINEDKKDIQNIPEGYEFNKNPALKVHSCRF